MTKEQIHEAIDRLTPDQLTQINAALEQISHEDPRERWRSIPGLKLPEIWPPDYGDFNPIKLTGEGESAAEQLIQERR